MNTLGLQLYSVRNLLSNDNEISLTLDMVYEAGYRQVQLAGDFESVEKIGKSALKKGFEILGYTSNFTLIEENTQKAINLLKELNAFDVSIGWFGFKNSGDVRDFIKKANSCAEIFAKNNVNLSYHNHSHEFERMENGKTVYDMLIEETDKNTLTFIPDTYWLQHAGIDVCNMLERLNGRFKIIHLKDMKIANNSPTFAEIGNGNLNWNGIIKTAEKCGAKYFVVEQDECDSNPIDSVKASEKFIRKNFMGD